MSGLGDASAVPTNQQKTLSKGHAAAAAEAAACCFLPLNNSVTQLKGKLSLKYKIKAIG